MYSRVPCPSSVRRSKAFSARILSAQLPLQQPHQDQRRDHDQPHAGLTQDGVHGGPVRPAREVHLALQPAQRVRAQQVAQTRDQAIRHPFQRTTPPYLSALLTPQQHQVGDVEPLHRV